MSKTGKTNLGYKKKSEEYLPGLSKDLSGGDIRAKIMSYILIKVLFAQMYTVMGTYQRYT